MRHVEADSTLLHQGERVAKLRMQLALVATRVASAWPGTDATVQTHGFMATKVLEHALEIQLACLGPPSPGPVLRSLMWRRLMAETAFGFGGIAVFRPMHNLRVFGKRVLFLSGWALEGGEHTGAIPAGSGHDDAAVFVGDPGRQTGGRRLHNPRSSRWRRHGCRFVLNHRTHEAVLQQTAIDSDVLRELSEGG